ncbi:MAG TPA: hypothetical protein VF338_07090, partial [Leptolinea sp.]
MKKSFQLLSMGFVSAALLLVVSACSSTPNEPAPVEKATTAPQAEVNPTAVSDNANSSGGMVKIDSYKLMQDNGSGAAGDEVKSFKATDHKQYFAVQLSDFMKMGSVVKWVFTAVDTSAGKDIKITEVNTKVVIGNQLSANLSLDKDFP